MYSIMNKKFCLSLQYNGQIVIYLLKVQKYTNLKKKILKFLWARYVFETFQKIG